MRDYPMLHLDTALVLLFYISQSHYGLQFVWDSLFVIYQTYCSMFISITTPGVCKPPFFKRLQQINRQNLAWKHSLFTCHTFSKKHYMDVYKYERLSNVALGHSTSIVVLHFTVTLRSSIKNLTPYKWELYASCLFCQSEVSSNRYHVSLFNIGGQLRILLISSHKPSSYLNPNCMNNEYERLSNVALGHSTSIVVLHFTVTLRSSIKNLTPYKWELYALRLRCRKWISHVLHGGIYYMDQKSKMATIVQYTLNRDSVGQKSFIITLDLFYFKHATNNYWIVC
jgi:hypothetical protein